jgi:hypothetical protein
MATVLAQPHRKGQADPRDPFHESPLGKFVLQHKLDRLCYDDALNFANLIRRFFAVKGVPQIRSGHVARDGLELSAEAVRRLQGLLDALEGRLRKVSRNGLSAVRQLAFFEREVPAGQAEAAARVLAELAAQVRS